MQKKAEKRRITDKKLNIAIILAIIVIVALGVFILKKPSITGLVVVTKETAHADNLNLAVNESKDVIWNVRNPGNLQSIKANGKISRNGTAKVYIEKDNERVLIFDSTKQLFDVNVEVLPDYKKIFHGEELLIQIVLFNLRGFGSADVNVKYSIKDPNGNLIATEEEIVTVETQAKFVRKLIIPSDLKAGTYAAFVEVKTPDGLIGTSSDLFEVRAKFEERRPLDRYYLYGIAGMLILAAAIILPLYIYRRLKKKKHVEELKEKIPIEKVQKLEKELAALESAYKSGFISEESCKKDKERLEKELKRLKAEKPKEQTKEEAKKPEERAADKPRAINGKEKTSINSKEKTAEDIVEEVNREDENETS